VRILIVDDDTASRELATRVVESMGHSALEAKDGEEGLTLARREQPDLLLLDLYMPGISGLQVVREIRADDRLHSLPVIAVSAGTAEDRLAALSAGCNEFVPKPYGLAVLRAVLDRHHSE
jgi:CheY-like chemotaxis protein